jgi:hypothetical protein
LLRQNLRENGLLWACVLLALVLIFDLAPVLRGGEAFGWLWPRDLAPFPRIVVLAALCAVYLYGLYRLGQRPALGLLWAVGGAVALAYTVTWLRHDNPLLELYYRTISLTATGPYTTAGMLAWDNTTPENWLAIMVEYRTLSQHVALSPPGLPMFYALLAQLLAAVPGAADALHRQFLPFQCNNYTLLQFTPQEWASAVFGVLMPVWGALTALPMYAAGRRLGVQNPVFVAGLWALVPAFAMFAGSWNTLYPLLAVAAFWGLLVPRAWAWLAAGILTGLLTFANLSVIPLGLLFGLYTLLACVAQQGYRGVRQAVWMGLWFGAGVALPWLLFYLASHITPLDIVHVAFEKHLGMERDPLVWLWMHGWEWALLGALPAVIVVLAGLRRQRMQAPVLPVALVGALAILILSSTARGETGRVWLFFVPFALLAAGQMLPATTALYRMAAAQAVLFVALAAAWVVMSAADTKLPPLPPPPHDNVVASGARFGDDFELVGWRAEWVDKGLLLHMNLRATRQIVQPYYFAALPVDPQGQPATAEVWQPQETRFPTTCWPPGMVIGETRLLPLPAPPAPGGWYISLSAFADVAQPMNTLPVTLADGSADRQVGLGPVLVGP